MATPSPLSPPPSIAVLPPDSPGASLAPVPSGIATPVTRDPVPVVALSTSTEIFLPEPPAAAPLPVAVDTPVSDSSMTVTSDPALAAPSETIVAPEVSPLETLASALFDRIQDLRSSRSLDAAAHDAAGQQLLGTMRVLRETPEGRLHLEPFQKVIQSIADRVSTPGWLKWGMELLSEGHKETLMQEFAMVDSEPEEAPRSAQRHGRWLVRRSPTPFDADIVEEIVDGPPTSPESVPADDEMVDADEPQVDELEGEDEVDPPSPKQVKPAPSTAKTPSSKMLVDARLRNVTVDTIDSQGVIHLKNGVLISRNQVLQSRPSYRDRSLSPDFLPRWRALQSCCLCLHCFSGAMSKSCYMMELEPICRKCMRSKSKCRFWARKGIPNPQDLKGWLPLHDFYELRGWPSPDEPSPEELHESHTAFKDYDEQIRALNKHGVGVKGTMEEQKAFREGRHVPRHIVPMHGKPPVLAPTVSSSTAGPSASTSVAFALPKVEEVKPSTTKAGRGVKRLGSMEGELDAPPTRRSRRALYNAQSKASSSGASVKKEVKEEVKEEVKSEPEDVKPAPSSRSVPARRAIAMPSGEVPFVSVPPAPYPTHASSVTRSAAASASSNLVEFAGVMVDQDTLSGAIADLFRKKRE